MNILAPFALVIGLLSLSVSPSPDLPLVRVMESIVKVTLETEQGETGYCTGFIADQAGRVVTASHCIPESHKIWVDGIPSRVIKKDAWVTVISGPEGKRPLPIAHKLPTLLEQVWSIGNGFDWGYIVLERKVAGFYKVEGKKHLDLAMNAPIAQGMSGGPIVNSKGEVVAINQLTTNATGIGSTFEEIKDALK